MKRSSYMSRNELYSFLKVGSMAGELEVIANQTPEKDWRQKLKTASKYLENITLQRLQCLDPVQLVSVARRKDSAKLVMVTEDANRYEGVPEEKATVSVEDLQDLAELALCTCKVCKQGDIVKDCRFRLAMHRMGIMPAENLEQEGPGICEYVSR